MLTSKTVERTKKTKASILDDHFLDNLRKRKGKLNKTVRVPRPLWVSPDHKTNVGRSKPLRGESLSFLNNCDDENY